MPQEILDVLGHALFEEVGSGRHPEGVGREARRARAGASSYSRYLGPSSPPFVPDSGPEERAIGGILVERGSGDVLLDPAFEIVPDGDLARLSAPVLEAEAILLAGVVQILKPQLPHRSGPGGGVDKSPDARRGL